MQMVSDPIDDHWEPSPERGFLPRLDPLKSLDLAIEFDNIEAWIEDLPILLASHTIRKEIASLEYIEITPHQYTGRELDRIMMLYSYLVSAYVHARGEERATSIPSNIARPLTHLSTILHRPPILSYWSYCLNNWERKDPAGPIQFDNLQLLNRFEDIQGDEDGFVLIHTDIEGRGGSKVVEGLHALHTPLTLGGTSSNLASGLEYIADGLARMNRTMARMPEACSKERYAENVRPYIFGFDKITYESHDPHHHPIRTLRGETGAQSSIVPAIDAALGIKHQTSILTQHLKEMRAYMPFPHRRFLEHVASMGIPLRTASQSGPPYLRQLYNDCIRALLAFNETHYRYAMEYVKAKVPGNPQGTGGTPYEKWLWQLQEERKNHLL